MHDDVVAVRKSLRTYFMVGAALLTFTVITVAANLVHLAVPLAITVALIIASFKASMVGAVFMHLSHEKRFIYGSLILTAIFFVALLSIPFLTIWDTYGTHIQRPAAHAPAEPPG